MPYAIAIGIKEEDFWHMTMRRLRAHIEAHEIQVKEQDRLNHMLGQYIQSAVASIFRKNQKYVEKPFLYEEHNLDTNKESNEEIAVFEMKQRINALISQGYSESPK